jgi:hypothetical protein
MTQYVEATLKSTIAMAKASFNKNEIVFSNIFDLNVRKKLLQYYIWSVILCGVETWTL